mmetsp:Transcript_78997/g.189704  ORF Transcript_78997/g.189704 Transcript_78997/m.189704 type:complete len:202 (-) Transcript_78997:44-649(-)
MAFRAQVRTYSKSQISMPHFRTCMVSTLQCWDTSLTFRNMSSMKSRSFLARQFLSRIVSITWLLGTASSKSSRPKTSSAPKNWAMGPKACWMTARWLRDTIPSLADWESSSRKTSRSSSRSAPPKIRRRWAAERTDPPQLSWEVRTPSKSRMTTRSLSTTRLGRSEMMAPGFSTLALLSARTTRSRTNKAMRCKGAKSQLA